MGGGAMTDIYGVLLGLTLGVLVSVPTALLVLAAWHQAASMPAVHDDPLPDLAALRVACAPRSAARQLPAPGAEEIDAEWRCVTRGCGSNRCE
jgi:hypothetical protein